MLKIVNNHKMIGQRFLTGRFICLRIQDSITHWRFEFEDTQWPAIRYVWVDVNKVASWDNYEKKWFYALNYPNCPTHRVSLDYFGNFQKACETFETALKEIK